MRLEYPNRRKAQKLSNMGNQIYFEYVSKYRRIVIVGEVNGFELRVTYRGIDIPSWSKNYGKKEDAIAWAKASSANRELVIGCLTIKEAVGKQII